jgi:hypothetical protein
MQLTQDQEIESFAYKLAIYLRDRKTHFNYSDEVSKGKYIHIMDLYALIQEFIRAKNENSTTV